VSDEFSVSSESSGFGNYESIFGRGDLGDSSDGSCFGGSKVSLGFFDLSFSGLENGVSGNSGIFSGTLGSLGMLNKLSLGLFGKAGGMLSSGVVSICGGNGSGFLTIGSSHGGLSSSRCVGV
jgi:hypothetical protein